RSISSIDRLVASWNFANASTSAIFFLQTASASVSSFVTRSDIECTFSLTASVAVKNPVTPPTTSDRTNPIILSHSASFENTLLFLLAGSEPNSADSDDLNVGASVRGGGAVKTSGGETGGGGPAIGGEIGGTTGGETGGGDPAMGG